MSHRAQELAETWLRRAVVIPAYFLIAGALAAAFPLWAVFTILGDAVHGDIGRLPRTRGLCFFALYLTCETVGVFLAVLLWAATFGGIFRTAYIDANYALQRAWSSALFKGAIRLFSMRVEIDGAEQMKPGPVLLFVRHSSTADTALPAALLGNPIGLRLRYVLKRELLWDPCLDIVGRRLPNAFIARNSAAREENLASITALADGLDERSGVLIYPEGTRFSPQKLDRAVQRLRDTDEHALASLAAAYRNVLPPRLGGPLALIDASTTAAVVFVDHCGFEGAATFAEFWGGGLIDKVVRIRLRRFEPHEIPQQGRDRWLFERWAELDEWLTVTSDLPAGEPVTAR